MPVRVKLRHWSDVSPQPWKNGGGVTYEYGVAPETADISSFDWRISLAEVASDGPFSIFAGVDRTLLLLEGAVELTVNGEPTTLAGPGATLAFDGGATTTARVLEGPARDLNIMSCRGEFGHRVTELQPGRVAPMSKVWCVVGLEPDVTLSISTRAWTFGRFDYLEAHGLPETAVISGRAYLVELSANATA